MTKATASARIKLPPSSFFATLMSGVLVCLQASSFGQLPIKFVLTFSFGKQKHLACKNASALISCEAKQTCKCCFFLQGARGEEGFGGLQGPQGMAVCILTVIIISSMYFFNFNYITTDHKSKGSG